MYLVCTRVVGLLPPVFVGSGWQLVDEGQAAAASDLDGLRLFRLGVRFLTSGFWPLGRHLSRLDSVVALLSLVLRSLGRVSRVGSRIPLCQFTRLDMSVADLTWFVCAFYVLV